MSDKEKESKRAQLFSWLAGRPGCKATNKEMFDWWTAHHEKYDDRYYLFICFPLASGTDPRFVSPVKGQKGMHQLCALEEWDDSVRRTHKARDLISKSKLLSYHDLEKKVAELE